MQNRGEWRLGWGLERLAWSRGKLGKAVLGKKMGLKMCMGNRFGVEE